MDTFHMHSDGGKCLERKKRVLRAQISQLQYFFYYYYFLPAVPGRRLFTELIAFGTGPGLGRALKSSCE